jgi:hypothetical protein
MATTTAITTPMITYFSAPMTPPKHTNEPLSVTAQMNEQPLRGIACRVWPHQVFLGTLIVVAGRCSTLQYSRAGKALTLIVYASLHRPDYDLDYTSRANWTMRADRNSEADSPGLNVEEEEPGYGEPKLIFV